MDVNRIFSAEQIAVPPELPHILKEWTKSVIRENPSDLLTFSLRYYQDQMSMASQQKAIETQIRRIRQLFEQYDHGGGRMEAKELKHLLLDDIKIDMHESEVDELAMDLDTESCGYIELNDIIQWYMKR